jgi:alkaline phosphatase
MTEKAIATLSKGGGPFVLMVEGASIDKQSHPNHAAGVIWDVIEFDKSIAVGRKFGASNSSAKNGQTLVLVTADHDQSMSIVGLSDVQNSRTVLNTRSISVYPLRNGNVFRAAYTNYATVAPSNAGNNTGEVSGFPDYVDGNGDGYPENTNRFRITVGFRTGNHTGSSVPITAEGPGAILFTGYQDQTDICWKMAKILSSNTAPLDELLKQTSKFSIVNQNY